MATVQVHEFSTLDALTGAPIWPAQRTTTKSTPGSVQTLQGTVLFVVTADANCRMGVNEDAGVGAVPNLSGIPNEFRTGSSASETLNFIAE